MRIQEFTEIPGEGVVELAHAMNMRDGLADDLTARRADLAKRQNVAQRTVARHEDFAIRRFVEAQQLDVNDKTDRLLVEYGFATNPEGSIAGAELPEGQAPRLTVAELGRKIAETSRRVEELTRSRDEAVALLNNYTTEMRRRLS